MKATKWESIQHQLGTLSIGSHYKNINMMETGILILASFEVGHCQQKLTPNKPIKIRGGRISMKETRLTV